MRLSVLIVVVAALMQSGNAQGAGAQVLGPRVCPRMHAPRKALPPGHVEVVAALSKSLDPSGCPYRMERGTMVFKIYTQRVTYTAAGPNGAPFMSDNELNGLIRGYFRSGSTLIVRMDDGRVLRYPANAKISPPNPNDFSLTFVAPGAPMPPDVKALRVRQRSLKPDYVVP